MIGKFLRSVFLLLSLPFIAHSQTLIPDEVRVDYAALKKEISSVIVDLSRKSDINISFDPKILPSDSLVSVSAKNEPLGLILDKILIGTECIYKIIGNQLVIVKDPFRFAKRKITLSGIMRDSVSGEPLVYANVYLFSNESGTHTNEFGFYSFTIDKGVQRIYYSYLGYKKEIIEIMLAKDTIINIELGPEAMLNEVLILDSEVDAQEKELYSADVLPMDKIWSMASLAGESDVIRFAQMMSGVSTGADGFGGLNVRGGSSDQNLVLYDGVPVYDSGHALGLFSIFNSSAIKSAKLIKGSFPSRYGGRLSSVLDIRTKEGSNKRTQGDVTLGALTFKSTLEGPISKGKSSYLISARRTLLDPWIKNLTSFIADQAGKKGEANIYFYDLNAKVNFKLAQHHSIFISGYTGTDLLESDQSEITIGTGSIRSTERQQQESTWGNQLLSVRLNSRLSQKAYMNLSVFRSQFRRSNFTSQSFDKIDSLGLASKLFTASLFNSKIRDNGVKADIDWIPSNKNFVRLGLGAIFHEFDPGLINVDQTDSIGLLTRANLNTILEEPNIKGNEFYVYLEDEIRLSKYLKFNLGLRANVISTGQESDFYLEPRLSMLIEGEKVFFKAGLSKMSQYLHLLSNSGLGSPNEIWIPSTNVIRPEESWIYNASFGLNFGSGLEFELEAYTKTLDKIVSFSEGSAPLINNVVPWDNSIFVGEGTSFGLEFNLTKIYGKTTILANYTWSKTDRFFNGLNNENRFNFRFDRRHQYKLGLVQKINKNAEFALNYIYTSGSPFTLPEGYTTFVDNEEIFPFPIFDERNGGRLEPYHRLDVAFNFYNNYSWGRQKLSLGLYNAYDRRNSNFVSIGVNPDRPTDYITTKTSYLPIIPSLSYSLSF